MTFHVIMIDPLSRTRELTREAVVIGHESRAYDLVVWLDVEPSQTGSRKADIG